MRNLFVKRFSVILLLLLFLWGLSLSYVSGQENEDDIEESVSLQNTGMEEESDSMPDSGMEEPDFMPDSGMEELDSMPDSDAEEPDFVTDIDTEEPETGTEEPETEILPEEAPKQEYVVGSTYGPYTVTDLHPVPGGVNGYTEISSSYGVHEFANGSSPVIVNGGTHVLIFDNGERKSTTTGAVAPLIIKGGANVTVYLVAGRTTTFTNASTDAGIRVESSSTLTIEGPGSLVANGGTNGAGIGGSNDMHNGKIVIKGGSIKATGGTNGAGIGGGSAGQGEEIIIEGGTVTATGGANGAGIGGGNNGAGGTVTITGGTVTANSGKQGAGIGGGNKGAGGVTTISNGIVNATGGANGGAGIGGGGNNTSPTPTDGGQISTGGYITITGGKVTALSRNGSAGIGGGFLSDGDKITISGGEINAQSTLGGAGIGAGGKSNCGTIIISGGTIFAQGSSQVSGIGNANGISGGTIDITGGVIIARSKHFELSGVGGSNGAGPIVTIAGGSVFSVSPINGTTPPETLRIFTNPTNGTACGSRLVYPFKVTLLDVNDDIIPNTKVSVLVAGDIEYIYEAITDANGDAYLWLPEGDHKCDMTGPGSTILLNYVISISNPDSEIYDPENTDGRELYFESNLEVLFTLDRENEKVFENETLTLNFTNVSEGSHPQKAILGVEWFCDSAEKPKYSVYNFAAGYAQAPSNGKGVGGVGETLNLTYNNGENEQTYSMGIVRNGRYWIRTSYITGSGQKTHQVDYFDVGNIYTPIEVYIRDWDVPKNMEAQSYTLLEGDEDDPYGIAFDSDGSTILTSPAHGYDTVTYMRNPDFSMPEWDMLLPGYPFTKQPISMESAVITLGPQVDLSTDKNADNSVTQKYYTVRYDEEYVTATIDLSTTLTGDSYNGYEVSGVSYAYFGTAITSPSGFLVFNANANGNTYKIIQSGRNTTGAGSYKQGTSIFTRITVHTGASIRLIISNIYMIGNISVEPGATLTLLLDDTNCITENIRVSEGATIIIDSLNNDDVSDSLTIASENDRNTNAGIGGEGGNSSTLNGRNGGTITINGGKIDIIMKSTGAGIGGGGGYNSGTNGQGGTVGRGGNGGRTTINGGNITITQNGSNYFIDGDITNGRLKVSGAGIGGGGSAGFGGGHAGTVVINGGKVTIRQTTRAAGIGGGSYGTVGNITISGGTVDVEVDSDVGGAGIGGNGTTTNVESGTITISGGTVRSVSDYTAIGIVNSQGNLDIVITGGDVYAKGIVGPGIGFLAYTDGYHTRTIKITGGKVTAISVHNAGIGTGANRDVGPPFELDAVADVRAYSSGVPYATGSTPSPAIYTKAITGNGYIVNAGISESFARLNTTGMDLYVYANGQASQMLNSLTLPATYRFFAYSSAPNVSRTDNVYYSYPVGSGILARESTININTNKEIFSVRVPAGYDTYNNTIKGKFWLPVKPEEKAFVIYKSNNSMDSAFLQNPDSGTVNRFTVLSTDATSIEGEPDVEFLGWNTKPDGSGQEYQIGDLITINNNQSIILYAIWEESARCTLTISKTVVGSVFYGPSTKFSFRVRFSGDFPLTGQSIEVIRVIGSGSTTDVLPLVAGVGVFELRHGESIKFLNIPSGSLVQIDETGVPNYYNVVFEDSSLSYSEPAININGTHDWSTGNARELSGDRAFHFINEEEAVVPVGVDIGDNKALLPEVIVSFLSMAFPALLMVLRQRFTGFML